MFFVVALTVPNPVHALWRRPALDAVKHVQGLSRVGGDASTTLKMIQQRPWIDGCVGSLIRNAASDWAWAVCTFVQQHSTTADLGWHAVCTYVSGTSLQILDLAGFILGRGGWRVVVYSASQGSLHTPVPPPPGSCVCCLGRLRSVWWLRPLSFSTPVSLCCLTVCCS